MFTDKDYRFSINISKESYGTKEEVRACLTAKGAKEIGRRKICFHEAMISPYDFEICIRSGYAFCALFEFDPDTKYVIRYSNGRVSKEYPFYRIGPNKGCLKSQFKRDEFFSGSQCVFIDIDYTSYTDLASYVEAVDPKPTVSYYTYSDTGDARRLRLCYVFDEIMKSSDFIMVNTVVHSRIESSTREPIKDKCGKKKSQYFNGTDWKDALRTDIIYSIRDFIDPSEYVEVTEKAVEKARESSRVSGYLVNDMERLSYEELTHSYSMRMPYWYRPDNGEWIDGKVQFVTEDYFSLYWNTRRLRDGEGRRKKLFERMCLRRVMRPEATPDQIMYNAYIDLHRFVDNTQDPITVKDLERNVISCFRMGIEEIREKYSYAIQKAKESTTPKKGMIYAGKSCVHDGNMRLIDRFFDASKTVQENVDILKANGISFSASTLYAYMKERGLTVKNKANISDKELYSLTDPSMSLRENVKNIYESYGIKVSKDKLNRIIKDHK